MFRALLSVWNASGREMRPCEASRSEEMLWAERVAQQPRLDSRNASVCVAYPKLPSLTNVDVFAEFMSRWLGVLTAGSACVAGLRCG